MNILVALILFSIPIPSFSANFEIAIPLVLKHEGKLVNDPNDKGGITNYGISLRYLKSLVASRPDLLSEYDKNHDKIIEEYDIAHMTLQESIEIYKECFWEVNRFGSINFQPLANKIFDLSVNVGSKRAIEFLQEACNKLNDTHELSIDGKMGNKTLSFVNKLTIRDSEIVLRIMRNISYDYYNYIAKRHPVYKKFLKGWLKRAFE